MLSVKPTTPEELAVIAVDPLQATSEDVYTITEGSTIVAYIGVNTFSLVATVGWPWVKMVRKDLLTARRVVKIAREALRLWASKYADLRILEVCEVNRKWFEILGFRLDTSAKPIYHGGKMVVQYRYGR